MDEPPSKNFLELISSGNSLVVWSGFALILLMLLVSAFIAATESVFFSLKGDELQRLENSTRRKERIVAMLLRNAYSTLSTIVILGYIINSAITSGTFLLITKIFGDQDFDVFTSISVTIISTFTLCTFIIISRVLASKNTVNFAISIAGTLNAFAHLLGPLTGFLVFSRNKFDGGKQSKTNHASVSGLNETLERVAEDEDSTEDEREILKGIVNFGTLTVKQVMRSRVDIAALDIELDFHELMNLINKSGFSRMPVYRDTVDRIEGVLYIKDLLPFIDHDENFKWQKLIRPGFFVPENKKIDVLLKDFQKRHVHMAIVVDEYGGTLGLITLEDIIEEIIGDINDEFDDEASSYRKIDETTFVFEGKTSLHDFCKVVEAEAEIFDEVRGESESLGGLILELNNELPSVGKKLSFEQFTFVIEAVDKRRIKRVRVHVHEQKES